VDALPPGTRLAEFEILALLGVGGFGMVYKAFDHSLHRAVAIKEYMPTALAGRTQGQTLAVRSSSDQQSYQAGLASFVEEARLLAQFDHPSLVKVFRFWEANNTAYMVMPLYSGMTFKQARAQMRTPPPEAWLRKVLWSVLSALRVLHDSNMLHRDISPDNIFLQDNGPPVLLDLGAARHAINDGQQKHTAVLKVNYAPIEQYAEGDDQLRQGPWSDLYSLAAVVHGCLCNDTPLPATLRAIRDRMVPLPHVAKVIKTQFGIRYSAPFIEAMTQALSIRPENRPQNIDALLQSMEMTAPPDGVLQFDFRADLGDVWVEPADQPGPGLVTPTVDVTSAPRIVAEIQAQTQKALDADNGPETVMLDGYADSAILDGGDTVFADDGHSAPGRKTAGQSEVSSPAGKPDKPATREADRSDSVPSRRRSKDESLESRPSSPRRTKGARASSRDTRNLPVGWMVVGLVALVVVAAGWGWKQNRQADEIITEVAEPPSAAVSAPAQSASAEEVVAQEPALAASQASEPVSAPVAIASAPVTPSPAASRPIARRKAATPEPVVAVLPPPAPEPPPPPPIEEPKPKPQPPRVPSPSEVCADAGFFARPMCIYQECQKPGRSSMQVCIENRQRLEAEEQRRRQVQMSN
jgi:serine/threonine protein kinase